MKYPIQNKDGYELRAITSEQWFSGVYDDCGEHLGLPQNDMIELSKPIYEYTGEAGLIYFWYNLESGSSWSCDYAFECFIWCQEEHDLIPRFGTKTEYAQRLKEQDQVIQDRACLLMHQTLAKNDQYDY